MSVDRGFHFPGINVLTAGDSGRNSAPENRLELRLIMFKATTRVLVTGGSGFIGTNLVHSLGLRVTWRNGRTLKVEILWRKKSLHA
jgi:hypothetical protein